MFYRSIVAIVFCAGITAACTFGNFDSKHSSAAELNDSVKAADSPTVANTIEPTAENETGLIIDPDAYIAVDESVSTAAAETSELNEAFDPARKTPTVVVPVRDASDSHVLYPGVEPPVYPHYAPPADVAETEHKFTNQSAVAVPSVYDPLDYGTPLPAPGPYVAVLSHPALHTDNYTLFQYRRMFKQHQAPHPIELEGSWRGINKGIATVAIDEQFVKEFHYVDGHVRGDNVVVKQVPTNDLYYRGWQPVRDLETGEVKRQGKFLVEPPRGKFGAYRNGVIFNYRKGGNRRFDPAKLIQDEVVKLDDNHMLGRATAKFGPIKIPLAFFVIERVSN